MIWGTMGKLGRGKTLSILLKAYEAYCRGKEVFSNIPLEFDHTPIKTPYDFLTLSKGFLFGDELWALLMDNRRSSSALNNLMTILLLRSRKIDLDVGYTQQYMQIDVRMAYITDQWIKPQCYPFDPEGIVRYKPEILVQNRWDGELVPLPTYKLTNLDPYLALYDTHKDPYTIKGLLDGKAMQDALKLALDSATDDEIEALNVLTKHKDKARKIQGLWNEQKQGALNF